MGRVFSRNGEEKRVREAAGCGLVSPGSRQVPPAGSCEYGNELSDSMQGREFVDQVSDCELLKKECGLALCCCSCLDYRLHPVRVHES
jgi:hypothetical protein